MMYIPYSQTEHQINDFIDSIKTYCILVNDKVEFNRKSDEKKGIMKFVIEDKTSDSSIPYKKRDKFDQESSNYASIRFIFDIRSNRLYIRTKFKAKTEVKIITQSILGRPTIRSVAHPQEIIDDYVNLNVKPIFSYNKRRLTSSLENTSHYYEHVFKIHKIDYEKINKIISVFIKHKNRHKRR